MSAVPSVLLAPVTQAHCNREMSHDEKMYPSSFTFDPIRFLENGRISKSVRDPRSMLFGFGRR